MKMTEMMMMTMMMITMMMMTVMAMKTRRVRLLTNPTSPTPCFCVDSKLVFWGGGLFMLTQATYGFKVSQRNVYRHVGFDFRV